MPTPEEHNESLPPPDNEGELEKALADAKHEYDELGKNMDALEQKARAGLTGDDDYIPFGEPSCEECRGRGYYYPKGADGDIDIPAQRITCACVKKRYERLRKTLSDVDVGSMDEISKAAREGKPLTDKMIRDAGLPSPPETADEKLARRSAAIEQKIQSGDMTDEEYADAKDRMGKMWEDEKNGESRKRMGERATARLRKNTSCIPHVDPETFQMDWRLMVDGSEIIRFDTNAMAAVRKNYPLAELPPELLALIDWFTKLGKERLAAKDEVFAGGAKHVRAPEHGRRYNSPDHSGMKGAQNASVDYQRSQQAPNG